MIKLAYLKIEPCIIRLVDWNLPKLVGIKNKIQYIHSGALINLCQIWSKLMCKKDRVPHRSCENKQLGNYPVCADMRCSPNMSIMNKPFSYVFN